MDFERKIDAELEKLHRGQDCMNPDEMEEWTVIVSEKKKTLVVISPFGEKYVKKAMDGDEFSIEKGIALAVFENNTGIRYQDLRRFFELFANVTDQNDPAMNFIMRFFEEITGLSDEIFNKVIKELPEYPEGKRFYIDVPTVGSINDIIEFICEEED